MNLPIIIWIANKEKSDFVRIHVLQAIFFPLWVIFGIYAAVASVKSFKGEIFKYAIIGHIIQRKVYAEN